MKVGRSSTLIQLQCSMLNKGFWRGTMLVEENNVKHGLGMTQLGSQV